MKSNYGCTETSLKCHVNFVWTKVRRKVWNFVKFRRRAFALCIPFAQYRILKMFTTFTCYVALVNIEDQGKRSLGFSRHKLRSRYRKHLRDCDKEPARTESFPLFCLIRIASKITEVRNLKDTKEKGKKRILLA